MSGFLAGKVWQSALAPHLKPLAAALADIANDDGTSIYPSVAYMAWLLGRSERAIQNGLSDLRAQGVLQVEAHGCGGKGHPTEYRLIESALPKRPPWKEHRQPKGETVAPFEQGTVKPDSPFPQEKGETVAPFEQERAKPSSPFKVAKGEPQLQKGEAQLQKGEVCDTKGCSLRHERVKPASPDPSVEPLVEPSVEPPEEPEAQPEKPAAPSPRAFTDLAVQLFLEKYEQQPTWDDKDFKQFHRLRKRRPELSLQEFERRYRIMLNSTDEFYQRQGGSLAFFCASFDRFIQAEEEFATRADLRHRRKALELAEFLEEGDRTVARHLG
ncbi:MAG: hypothetical protein HY556_06090 [Euryarchaeota archaeon]|nr:hypothetical protein [Euryarchaeota archaeon]